MAIKLRIRGTHEHSARVGQALHLLLTSRLPVKTIAARVGYDSAATFSKRFSERYGLDPAQVGRR
ncbi:helix-turn-helix domain-containing protein [Acidovorax sp. BLS4]|uniref:helix-turn-helix domain-containing protein n=1 Tax=Acidovorax sp. BLS4 TaxID=3273430 RepID=UPI00355B126D